MLLSELLDVAALHRVAPRARNCRTAVRHSLACGGLFVAALFYRSY